MKNIFKIILMFILLMWKFPLQANENTSSYQTKRVIKKEKFEIFFSISTNEIDSVVRGNQEMLRRIYAILHQLQVDRLKKLLRVEVMSYASPDGDYTVNRDIVMARTETVLNKLESFKMMDARLMHNMGGGIAWDMLIDIANKSYLPYKEEVVNILKYTPENVHISRTADRFALVKNINTRLKAIDGGKTYKYLNDNVFPRVRKSVIVVIYEDSEVVYDDNEVGNETQDVKEAEKIEPSKKKKKKRNIDRTLFSLRTNLLYDAVAAVNAGVEVPFGDRVSLALNGIFPQWPSSSSSESKRNSMKILEASAELKYWFGSRGAKQKLHGWFIGTYGGVGNFDISYKRKGCMGDYFIGGLSFGYGNKIGKKNRFLIEYSLGLGILKSNYDKYSEYYKKGNWISVVDKKEEILWYGPNMAKVSLVWLIKRKK